MWTRAFHLVCFLGKCGKNVVFFGHFHFQKVFSLPVNCLPCTATASSDKRSSSSQSLATSAHDDVRAERAAIALSVGLNWPPDRYTKGTRGRPTRQQLWERALQEHIIKHHELPQGTRLQRPAWWRPGEAIDRPLTYDERVHIETPCAAAPCAAAAAPVEDAPSCSRAKRRKIHVDPIVRDWVLDMQEQWQTERRWDMQRCLHEVQRLCAGMFDRRPPKTRPIAGSATRRDGRKQKHAVAGGL